jgi:hypothetical protein
VTDDELFEHCLREHGLVVGKDVTAEQLMWHLRHMHDNVHQFGQAKHSHEVKSA